MTNFDDFLSHTEALINHIYWFKHDLNFKPPKEHIGSAINFTDLKERKHDFLNELVNTVSAWVYNRKKSREIIDQRLKRTSGDISNASAFLTTQAFSKFRPGNVQGQFGELLLFNFIQHFFKAIPLLRKQRITTSTGHERFGADAIHFKLESEGYVFYLGESKCYESKYTFKVAFESSLKSICNTFEKFDSELSLYTYDDFIEPELQDIAVKYKSGELENVRFELLCLIVYNENRKATGANESAIKDSIKSIIEQRCVEVDTECFSGIDTALIARINYVVFPIWELDKYLEEFKKLVGSK